MASSLRISTTRSRSTSPAQSAATQTLSGLSRMFKALSMTQKGQWQLAANELNQSLNRTSRHKMTAANAFNTINSARLAAMMDVISEPILPITGPAVLSQVTLQAAHTGSGFTLTLNSLRPIQDQLVVQSAPPVLAGRTTYSSASFKPVGVIDGLNGLTTITYLFVAKYGIPQPGSAIALRLYAVSDAGLRSDKLVVTTVYLAPSADAALPGDDSALQMSA